MSRENLIAQTIILSKRKVKLLEELRQSEKREKCTYDLIKHKEGKETHYSLWRIKDKKNLFWGEKERLQSYMKLRNINIEDVYERS